MRSYNKLSPTSTTSELSMWLEESVKDVIEMVDKMFDQCDTPNPVVQQLLEDASDILLDIDELETETNNILQGKQK
jgi:hypothetical protein